MINKKKLRLNDVQKYKTLEGQIISLSNISKLERKFLERILSFYFKKPDWNNFANYWLHKIHLIYKNKNKKEISESICFLICQDLEARLGISQGKTRLPDYRDQLSEIVDIFFGSRYAFCKRLHVDEGYLSNVLNKKRHISIDRLTGILNKVGYELDIRKKPENTKPYELVTK